MSEEDWRFTPTYAEEVALPGGLLATLRLLRPEDKEALVEGFEHLGSRSRYFRFFTGKPELTERELHYFTEADGTRHFAIGALIRDNEGTDHPAGTGRFIRIADSDSAEFAVTVVDDFQHLGIGSLILDRLMSAARERGVREFLGDVLAENSAMLGLVRHAAANALLIPEGPTVNCIIPLV